MEKIRENIKNLTTKQLLLMMEKHQDYTEEALIFAKEELKARNVTDDYNRNKNMQRSLSKSELFSIIRKLCLREGTNDEMEEWIDLIQYNVDHPNVEDLILVNDKELSPEEILDIAINYKKTKQEFLKKVYFISSIFLSWTIYFLFMVFKERLYYLDSIYIIKFLALLSMLSVMYSSLIFIYFPKLYRKIIIGASYLFTIWIMYLNYVIYELEGIEFDKILKIVCVVFIILPLINTVINGMLSKDSSKAIKNYVKNFLISTLIGIGYYWIYMLSIFLD